MSEIFSQPVIIVWIMFAGLGALLFLRLIRSAYQDRDWIIQQELNGERRVVADSSITKQWLFFAVAVLFTTGGLMLSLSTYPRSPTLLLILYILAAMVAGIILLLALLEHSDRRKLMVYEFDDEGDTWN